ncbi:DNA polymerase III subunit delta [Fundicoccus sp. Sow4_D5]|uniref:DNA polymerase III subunit delta n=1 Tax=Fundicoccus sp. Sow4_D5 TaxID=3438782 RepID=UPI003F8FAEB1
MDYQKAIQDVKKGNLKAVYTIFGSELFLQQEFLQILLNQFGEADNLDMAKIDLSEQSLDAALDEAEMFSFFAEYRLIIVENVQFLNANSSQKLSTSEEKRLLDYINNPNEASVIVFVIPFDQVDKRKKLTKAFQKQTAFIEVNPLKEQEVSRYIQRYIEGEQLNITREASQELLVRVNYQLTEAMGEISKLKSFSLTGQPITIDVVRTLVPRTLESNVFELTDAVMKKRVDKAVQIYQDLILMKHEPIALHALIISQFRLIIQSKLLNQQGYLEADIAKELSVHPYRVKLALQSGRRSNLKPLAEFYDELIEVDYHMKTGVGIKETHFYLLLTKLVSLA